MVNLHISYKPDQWSEDLNTDFTLGSCLFGSVKQNKYPDLDKYKYSSYGIDFDSCSEFLQTEALKKKVIIFATDMSSSVHTDNKNKDMLILGEGSTQGLDYTKLAAEATYPFNFTQSEKDLY